MRSIRLAAAVLATAALVLVGTPIAHATDTRPVAAADPARCSLLDITKDIGHDMVVLAEDTGAGIVILAVDTAHGVMVVLRDIGRGIEYVIARLGTFDDARAYIATSCSQ